MKGQVATLLAGTEVATSGYVAGSFPDFKTELQSAKKQIETIKACTRTLSTDTILINH